MKLLFLRLRFKASLISLLCFFLATSCDSSTDKLLVFPGNILSQSERRAFVGHYSNTDNGLNYNLREEDTSFFAEACNGSEAERMPVVISKIPQHTNLYTIALVSNENTGYYIFYILRLENTRLIAWSLNSSGQIASDYLPQNVRETDGILIYPVETMKRFLINYGEAYTLANEPIHLRKAPLKKNICL